MNEAELKRPLSKRELIGYAFFGLFVIIILTLWNSDKTPKISDRDAFFAYYKQMLAACASLDKMYGPFADALGKQKWLEAAQIAKRIKAPMNYGWSDMMSMEAPKLKNAEAMASLKKGKEQVDLCYYHKNKIIDSYLDLLKNPSGYMDSSADILNSTERAQQTMISGFLSLYGAGMSLGLTAQEMKP